MEPITTSHAQMAGWTFWIVFLYSATLASTAVVPTTRKDVKEYCSSELFDVACAENEVILMKSALYGRMQPGRCISGDYHHTVGCFNDILSYMDSRCSGRQSCVVVVGMLEQVAQPCQKDFKSYLEASYICVPVVSTEPKQCNSAASHELAAPTGTIGRQTLVGAGQALPNCLWSVTADPGQQVSLTMNVFREPIDILGKKGEANAPASARMSSAGLCPWKLVVRDGEQATEVSLCDAEERERHVFTSRSNKIDMHVVGSGTADSIPYFLIKYEAVGCADIEAPKRAWVRRKGDNLIMRCNETGETWYLTCRSGGWIGDVGNCTGSTLLPASRVLSETHFLQEGVVFAVIVGIVLGLVIGTSMLGIVFFCRRRWMHSAQRALTVDGLPHDRPATLKASYPALLRQEKQISGNVCEYTHVWEVRPTNMATTNRKEIEGTKGEDCYLSTAMGLKDPTVPGICTKNMMGSHGIYETSKRMGDPRALCLKHDTPLYFELDPDGKRTCSV